MTRDELMFARLRNAEADLREAEAVYAYWSAQAEAAGLVELSPIGGGENVILKGHPDYRRAFTAGGAFDPKAASAEPRPEGTRSDG